MFFEPGAAQPPVDGHGVAAGDLVFAEDLEELDVAEFPGAGLGQPGVDGVEHAGQLQGPQGLGQRRRSRSWWSWPRRRPRAR